MKLKQQYIHILFQNTERLLFLQGTKCGHGLKAIAGKTLAQVVRSQEVVIVEGEGRTDNLSLAAQWKRRRAALEMLIGVLEGGIGRLRSDALNLDRYASIFTGISLHQECGWVEAANRVC